MIIGNRSAYWVIALTLCFLAEGAGAQIVVEGGPVRRVVVVESSEDPERSTSGPATLVPYDDEVNRYLAETRSLIEAGQIDQAIRNLQVLLGQQESLFVPAGDGRRYVALRDRVNEVIGQLDRQGLRRYRVLYEPPAERLYQQAVADGDRQLLRQVVRDYVHTRAGLKALEALGHEAFNRAQFSTAARHWRRAIGLTDDHAHGGVLLAEVAVAHHLAGQSAAADQAQGDLEARHADLEAPLGGRRQNVLAFVKQMRQRPAWPKQAALSEAAVMSKAEMPSETEWIFTHQGGQLGPDLALLATEQSLGTFSGQRSIKLRDGLIVTQINQRSGAQTNQASGSLRQIMPALIYPVAVDGQLILRTEKAVISCDLRTGQPLWRQAFPVYSDARELGALRARMGMRGRVWPFGFMRDIGRYWLAVGDGKVFVTGGFSSAGANVMRPPPRGRGISAPPLRSELMAVSIHQQGRVIWSVPDSRRDDSELGVYQFVSPPVYHEGKVLLVASYVQNFHLLCLDADDGRLLWKSLISQMPDAEGLRDMFPRSMGMELLAQASPPAVADGRVFVATNAGVVAAYEADSGRALWAYQYDRVLGLPAQAGGGPMPVNPVLVLGDSVICLPADGSQALCLSGEDGRLRWRAGRNNQHYLTALDDRRVLLSREGLTVLSVDEGGKTLLAVDASGVSGDDPGHTGVYGRPVVTPAAALLSGRGELIRLDLTGERLTPKDLSSFKLPGPGIILGNLIAADGRIIAANAAGVATYVSYETVCRQIDAKLASAPPARRPELLYRRAMAAVNSRRYAAALEDLRRCERTADELAVAAPEELDGMLYRTYVAVGNRADSNERMLAMFAEADRYAQGPQERGHNLLRRAKAYAAGGDIAAALAVAHDLADRFGEENLVDVEIGPAAGMTRFGPLHVPISGWTLIHEGFIADLIAEHGRDIYAPYDARAEAELAEARQLDNPDALETVGRRWPNSVWADEALFAAAERFYRQADALSGDQADARLERARGALAMIVRHPDSPLAVSAHVGRAALLVRRGHHSVAAMAAADARRLARREVGDRADQMPVRFVDLAGPLSDVLVQILEGVSARPTEPEQPPPPDLPLPLRKLFVIQPAPALLLREGLGKVIRIDRDVFVFTESQLLRVDTAADNIDQAIVWQQDVSVKMVKHPFFLWLTQGQPPVSGLSLDGETLLVADIETVTGFDVQTGQTRWTKPVVGEETGIHGAPAAMICGADAWVVIGADGAVACLDIPTGAVRWRSTLGQEITGPRLEMRAGIVLVTNVRTKTAWCIDVASGKRLANEFRANQHLSALVTGGGFVVVASDGELTAYDVEGMSQPLWSRKLPGAILPTSLEAVGTDRIAVGINDDSGGRVELVSLADGRTSARIEAAPVGGLPAAVSNIRLWAGDLYLVCWAGSAEQMGRSGLVSSARLQKIDLTAGRLVWNEPFLRTWPARPWGLSWAFTGNCVVVACGGEPSGRAYVLSLATGRVADSSAGPVRAIENVATPPAIVDGRLIVVTTEGLCIYGKAN